MNTNDSIFEELGFDTQAVRQPESAVIYSLARTYNLVIRKLSRIYHQYGLTAAGFNLLLLLQRGKDPDSFTQREIGKRLVVSASDMSGLIDRMEKKGFVKRMSGKDRRSHLLKITPKGNALIEKVWPHHAEAIEQMTKVIDPQGTRTLLQVLGKLRHSMGL